MFTNKKPKVVQHFFPQHCWPLRQKHAGSRGGQVVTALLQMCHLHEVSCHQALSSAQPSTGDLGNCNPRVVVVKGDWYIQYIICIHADWCISNCVCITMYTCMYTYYIYSIYIYILYIYTLRLVRSYDPQSASWSGVGSKRWAPRNPKWLTSPQLIQQGKWSHRSELGFLSPSAKN